MSYSCWGSPCTSTPSLLPTALKNTTTCSAPSAFPPHHTKRSWRQAGFMGLWIQVAFHSLFQGGGARPGSGASAKHAGCAAREDPSWPASPGSGSGHRASSCRTDPSQASFLLKESQISLPGLHSRSAPGCVHERAYVMSDSPPTELPRLKTTTK